MHRISSYVWLLLLVICCWHCMARPGKDKTKAPKGSSHSHSNEKAHSHSHSNEKAHSHSNEKAHSHSHSNEKVHSHSHERSSHSHSHEEGSSKEKGGGACKDGKKSKGETDTDCGGDKCLPCAYSMICKDNSDCFSGICKEKRCAQRLTRPTTTARPVTTTVTTTEAPSTTTEAPSTTTEVPSTTTEVPSTTTEEFVTIAKTSPTCDFECMNNGMCTDYNECTCADGFSGPTCEVQSVGLCLDDDTFGTEPILLITFGSGSSQYSTATPADFNFNTTYRQRFEPTTNDGMFSFVNSVHNDFNGAWHTGATDHSEDSNGYMYLVNADFKPGQFYNGRVDNLCIGLRYEFSVYLANLCKPNGKINPNVLFEVRSVEGNVLLAQLESGDVVEHNTLTWEKYGFSFVASSSSVNLLMISNAPGGGGNDLVIDDIALRVCASQGSGFCPSN